MAKPFTPFAPFAPFTLFLALCLASAVALGASPKPKVDVPTAAKPAAKPAENLSLEEQLLAEQFKDLEKVLVRMRDLTKASDPRRAVLLEKTLKESSQRQINQGLEEIVQLLQKDQFAQSLDGQTKIDQDLKALLELLLSENRANRIESEKARYRKYIERINQIIREQKDVQDRTAAGDDAKNLSGQQGTLADKTGKLSKDIRTNEEGGAQKAEGGGRKAEGKDDSKGKGEGKPEGKAEGKGEGKAEGKGEGKAEGKAEGKPEGKAEGKGEGKAEGKGEGKGQGQQGQGQGGGEGGAAPQNASEPDENPARQRLDAARQRMEEARKRLDEAQRKGAVEEQEKAIRELQQAKAELEEILRQLREEEIKRLLAMLEARFQEMLRLERLIQEGTVRLDKVPPAERDHNHEIESARLSGKQTEIVVEVDKALALLREEGSAVALPEAVQQMRDDMQQVVHRLAQGKVEKITQGIESDIITALEEIIDALKKAQKDKDAKSKPSQPGQCDEPPLIELLAELKMIRALQMRVNRRTDRYAKLIQGEQAHEDDILDALRRLAEQQQRIHRVTRDLELGKNQ